MGIGENKLAMMPILGTRLGVAGLIVLVVSIVSLVIFKDTTASIVSIWMRSETFAHGFLVIPVTLWLIWDKRHELSGIEPESNFSMLVPLAAMGFIWLLANWISVIIVQQFALVAMLVFSAWTILGTTVIRTIQFPLAFLFLAVPAGEDLIYPLMEFTATFTVGMVKLTGIPVYRDGMFFALPTGNWSVIDGCSGIRYLIASITLGLIYAYLNYQSIQRRLFFVFLSFIVPIFANGLRAYMIVMIGHFSGMKLATGVDHILYGWVFFGIVMFLLFYIGHFWSEPRAPSKPPPSGKSSNIGQSQTKLMVSTLLVLSTVYVWPAISAGYSVSEREGLLHTSLSAFSSNEWKASNLSRWEWSPAIRGADVEYKGNYEAENGFVSVYIGVYIDQQQGSELVTSTNVLVDKEDDTWRSIAEIPRLFDHGLSKWEIEQTTVVGNSHRLLVWRWFRVGSRYTSNSYYAKLLQLWSNLIENRVDASVIVIATPYQDRIEEASSILDSFTRSVIQKMESSIDTLVGLDGVKN